jgi:TonB family protein
MLDPHLNRRPVSRATYAALAITLVAASVSIAAVQQRLSVVSGSIADPMNGALPGVTLVLTNVQNESKFEVRTDASGRYEFVGVPAGDYLFEARLPGFSTFKGKVTVTTDVQRDLTMELGTVQETITISAGPSTAASAVVAAAPAARARRPLPDCGSAQRADGRVVVGGNIRAPVKLLDVRPVYPPHLGAMGAGGAVVLKGRIGIDGRVEDLKVVSTAHQDLASAAVDAVSRWEFDATLLNCTPIATAITINVNFEPERR